MAILIFFLAHWWISVFFQTFFLHRYGAHKQYSMSPRVEKVMHLLTFISQGSSYLSPRGYAILHRMHHAYSDSPKDPHSPRNHEGPFALMKMMWHTKKRYDAYAYDREQPEPRFEGGYPEWPLIDRTLGQSWIMRFVWMGLYTSFYVAFANHAWMYALLPVHFVMGPVHGAIVNWCGHKYGYRNFAGDDDSKNTLVFDFLTLGELFQNNHHRFGMATNFAVRRFELDPTYQVMRLMQAVGLIDMSGAQKTRWTPKLAAGAAAAAADAE